MSRVEVLDPYNIPRLTATLRIRKLGYESYYTPETPTTMSLAENHARTGGQIPAIFLADHQTRGIGRKDRTWLDKPGASILVTGLSRIKPNTIPIFADMVALHTCRAMIASTGIDEVRIKYPNDLVIDDKKAGGLLVVNILDGIRYLGTSAGIGINVHYSKEEVAAIPTDYGATALDLHTPKPISRQLLLLAIFDGFQFLPVDAGIFQTNFQAQQDNNNIWRNRSSLLGRHVQVETAEQVVTQGKVVDTQIGKGICLENPLETRWFNQFDAAMKVRMLNQ